MTAPLDYRTAGVDITAGDSAKERLKKLVDSTRTAGTLGEFGTFGGLFRAPGSSQVLVASADGVGTKIKVAIAANKHDTVGHDLVNHCVNDILAQGATPLFFLDYVAFGALDAAVLEAIVAGVAAGCRENGCALLGGETAQLPGIYTPPDYDLAGFIVGSVDEGNVLGKDRVRQGAVLVGLASHGLHTNGYSLARRIVAERLRLETDDPFPEEDGTVGDVLLRVHRSYLAALRPVLQKIHALAHITGGGIPGNLNRVLPADIDATVLVDRWDLPPLFRVLEEAGRVPRDEMFRAFNMGIGMIAVCSESVAEDVITSANAVGIAAWRIGHTSTGSGHVHLDHG
ncbi:MAG: phosphoribosylformylglycinamidine cyclo-ligase [Gemmatimonadota bacterium]